MKTYLVTFESIEYHVYEIEAENEQEAFDLCEEKIATCDIDICKSYGGELTHYKTELL
jgi:hypothetical protein